jgi:hypothetical protein
LVSQKINRRGQSFQIMAGDHLQQSEEPVCYTHIYHSVYIHPDFVVWPQG